MSAPVDSTPLAEQMRGLIWTAPEDRDLPVVKSRLASKSLDPERIEHNDEAVRCTGTFAVPGVDARVVHIRVTSLGSGEGLRLPG
jgi:hypothetical protein